MKLAIRFGLAFPAPDLVAASVGDPYSSFTYCYSTITVSAPSDFDFYDAVVCWICTQQLSGLHHP